jgi:AcrR family transcriptional regulator
MLEIMARHTLTREKIVRTAIEMLDEDGLEGLSMRSLGERLGSAATAVYWHVKNKDNLVALAGDAVWNEIELPDLNTIDWRTAGITMAKEEYAMFARHPWLVQAMGTHMLYGPGKARHDDHKLAVYEMAGFVDAEADQAVAIVFMFVLGSAFGASASASLRGQLRRDGGDADEMMRAIMAQQMEIAMQFPRLRARAQSIDSNDYYAAPEKSFEIGLEAIFDSLERQLRPGRAVTENRARGWFG